MDDPTILSFGEIRDGVEAFAKQEEIDDLSQVLVIFNDGKIMLKAFCGKSFNEAMSRGEFDFN